MNENNGVVNMTSVGTWGDPAAIFKLYEAIGKAEKNFKDIPKNAPGQYGFTKFSYAPYHVIRKCILDSLTAEGVTIMQPMHSEGAKMASTLIVSGHGAAISSTVLFECNQTGKDGKFDVQLLGKEHTYIRRYQLQAFFCLEGDKDADDLDDSPVNVPTDKVVTSKVERAVAVKPSNGKVDAGPVQAKEQPATKAPSVEGTGKVPGNGAADAAKSVDKPVDVKTINDMLLSDMKHLSWKMDDLNTFCKTHVDKFPDFVHATKLTAEHKRTLHGLLVQDLGCPAF